VFLRLVILVAVVDLFYMWIGQTVTQSEEHPPPELEITTETDELALVGMGEELFAGKGGCLICHKLEDGGSDRGPDLRGMGGRAATQREGMGAEEYLMESLVDPAAFVVEKYPAIMPPANLPPGDLSATEVKAVVAFLQSMGGEVTVEILPEDVAAAMAKAASAGGLTPAETYLTDRGCVACHDVRGQERRVGPALTGVASRLAVREIRQSIVDPDAVVAEGFPAGLCPKVDPKGESPAEVDMLVDYLVGLGGPAAGTTPWERLGRMLGHPMLQLILLVFVLNAGAWWAIEWLEAR
jgi:cytochrome c2